MDKDANFARAQYSEGVMLALSGYQLIEALLKTYLRNYFKIIRYACGPNIYFGFDGKDYENAALGTLLKIFKKACSDTQLVNDLQSEIPHRDDIAHQAALVLYQHEPVSVERLNELSSKIAIRGEKISALLRRINEAHAELISKHSGRPIVDA